MGNHTAERETMSEVLDRPVLRSAPDDGVVAPAVTDRDHERVAAFITTAFTRPPVESKLDGDAIGAPAKMWRPAGGRGLRAVEGIAVAAVMGYFALGLFSVITGV